MIKRYLIFSITLFLSLMAHAAVPDSIKQNLADYDYLTNYTETNLATYPYIVRKRAKEYKVMRRKIRNSVKNGESILDATCDYVFWLFSHFDTHFYVDNHHFWSDYDIKIHPRYKDLIEYDPLPLAQAVDSVTFLIRVPSCDGRNPTFAWTDSAVVKFVESHCYNLIIDVRGNTGGSDMIWQPFFPLLIDHLPRQQSKILFRNTPQNRKNIEFRGMDSLIDKAKHSKQQFIPLEENEEDEKIPPLSSIKNVAVIIDSRTASSVETIVRLVKDYCNRGEVYGRDNTNGAYLSGNIAKFSLPNSGISCYYPTCIDDRFTSYISQKGIGIEPDIRINLPLPMSLRDNIDSWTLWVTQQLESKNR
ncbi:MAG: S41 family peptidase [Prevotella sp.]|jgi:hypothetical protein|nr:S41 family peptidase [Prevotella sp.]